MLKRRRSSRALEDCSCAFAVNLPASISLHETHKSRAALHHPDKATSAEARGASEGYFVHLKLAQDTLLDPAKRFAYDRFGPDMVQWRHCTSVRDYVLVGVQSIAPYYAASALFMIILGVLGYLEWGHYVRFPYAFLPHLSLTDYSPIVAVPIRNLPDDI